MSLEELLEVRYEEVNFSKLLLKYDDGLILENSNLRPLSWHEYDTVWKYNKLPFGYYVINYPKEIL